LFQDSWQLAGHLAEIPNAGDFLAVDLGVERALVVRAAAGQLSAFRNSCSEAPHALVHAAAGHLDFFQCTVHALQFELDGRRRGTRGGADLKPLELRTVGELLLVRSAEPRRPWPDLADPWREFSPPPGTRPLGPPRETPMAADWKLVVEQWLESIGAGAGTAERGGWSARAYQRLLGSAADVRWQRRFLAPNHLVEVRPDGFCIYQVLPVGPGRSLLRRHAYSSCEAQRPARAAQYLASRQSPYARSAAREIAESTQKGMVIFGHEAALGAHAAPAVAAFRRQLLALVPMLGLARPPNDA
jgi:phenylpropionate dioxygenase-like ring-hydroxylating dioxygenase large terminal subunit